jgi:hypothetical protein
MNQFRRSRCARRLPGARRVSGDHVGDSHSGPHAETSGRSFRPAAVRTTAHRRNRPLAGET